MEKPLPQLQRRPLDGGGTAADEPGYRS